MGYRSKPVSEPAAGADNLTLLRWHLDRYDRLRASTVSRAAVVLSASGLVSAAFAVTITQLVGDRFAAVPIALYALCGVIALTGVVLVVVAIFHATDVLTTPRGSSAMFAQKGAIPSSPVFNSTQTARDIGSFAEFATVVDGQTGPRAAEAAKAELWICILQHRYRYEHMRRAVRFLRYAAAVLPVLVTAVIVLSAVYRR
ncbi:hypothetical protein [Actinoplanes palleronii]|uniref:hypothetical protein n=1 Tax=Actinoplanes palleronii TaxID=113570 RepID=UPI00194356EF|nr:hypothetical protein [Actinoplanes palleronii]